VADTGVERRPTKPANVLKAHSFKESTAAYVKARVNGRLRHCLLDSGADVSLIPSHFVNTSKIEKSERLLRAANNTVIQIDGQIDLILTIEKMKLHANFLVSPNTDEIILGRDWLHEHDVDWKFRPNTVRIHGRPCSLLTRQLPPQCKRCRLSSDLEVPASSESIITVDVAYGNFKQVANEVLWTTVPSEATSGLIVARTLVSSDKPTAFVRVCNSLPRPIMLQKGQLLCNVQQVYPAAENDTSAESKLSVNSAATQRHIEPTPEEQRQTILDRVDPSVPAEIKNQLQDLMTSYSEIFSYGEYETVDCTRRQAQRMRLTRDDELAWFRKPATTTRRATE
jgi:predicted aspartyl protease